MKEQLEDELAQLACKFRGAPPGSQQRRDISEQYSKVMEQLFKHEDWCGEPDVDSQLPNDYMPEVYKEYWRNKLGDW